ncbi:MAG: ribonuclease HII [Pygmaiobacter massiliensis]|nr:ribonuclease HII [Pygmaiobacter massiliensis]
MAEKANLFLYDAPLIEKAGGLLAGVDEAGRGPLAGPVCTAAVILPPHPELCGLNDSKKLSEKRREALYEQIIQQAIAYQIVMVGPETIDQINILQATMLGMKQALEALDPQPALALIDGNRCPDTLIPTRALVKGDATSACVAAASILAKVTRDRYMIKLGQEYPQYQFEKHKGYPTKLHYQLIEQYGIQPFYRKSFLKKRGYT